jgi:hypothetical protein
MKATEWKPDVSYVVLQRLGGLLPFPGITLDFMPRYSANMITEAAGIQISQQRISLPKDLTWRSNERITGSPTGPSHCWGCLPNAILKDQENMTEQNFKSPY